MKYLYLFFADKPHLGMAVATTGTGTGLIALLTHINPVLTFISLIVGITAGTLTAINQWKQRKK
jgi:hypothetical protein